MKFFFNKPVIIRLLSVAIIVCVCGNKIKAQSAWYIDGFHGGIWGHYPDWNTRFMADMLTKNPKWKINIEIEPETWDRAEKIDPAAYADFKALFTDQSLNGRIEYINPAYAQSYMYNISGESIIRQFTYGIKKIKEHFPTATFSTYSTEEPCFTSALPQILKSFGFKYASLKNPNTCFGGYSAAHGGELVNWVGPDGTRIETSPRYAIEKLASKSTWQTIAWNNSPQYVNAALADGIKHPIGMTLQDAGWKGGSFIGWGKPYGIESTYTTWRNYFANVVKDDARPDWKLSQEDIQVSLVWGSQVTQQLAQKVRVSENKIIAAEKLAALAKLCNHTDWPGNAFDAAWRTLLLSQHHDCWIVPYNGQPGDTWADKVTRWTGFTNRECDSVKAVAGASFSHASGNAKSVVVFNTTSVDRNEVVGVALPANVDPVTTGIFDSKGNQLVTQQKKQHDAEPAALFFKAKVPALGYAVFQIKAIKNVGERNGASVKIMPDGHYRIETDLYNITLDPARGGIVTSLIAKRLQNKEFVDQSNPRGFNEIRGNFYNDGGFKSNTDSAAKIEIMESGPLRVSLSIKGKIAGNDYTQLLTLAEGQPRIDIQTHIDWRGNPGIGQAMTPGTYKWELPAKPFYDDRNKLLALFPLNLKTQKVYKNAPFDVTESRLANTFFTRWDSIKNNVILNWVDVTGDNDQYGMALFTDHTTSYTHGKDFPLGLDLHYSGMGLWGRNYIINGPSDIHYALVPHAGKWDRAGIWTEGTKWNEPLVAQVSITPAGNAPRSLIRVSKGVEVTSVTFSDKDMLVRLFNAEANSANVKLALSCKFNKAVLVELDGRKIKDLNIEKQGTGALGTTLAIPRFGIRTIKIVAPTTN
jgi:alpha-mannosidase